MEPIKYVFFLLICLLLGCNDDDMNVVMGDSCDLNGTSNTGVVPDISDDSPPSLLFEMLLTNTMVPDQQRRISIASQDSIFIDATSEENFNMTLMIRDEESGIQSISIDRNYSYLCTNISNGESTVISESWGRFGRNLDFWEELPDCALVEDEISGGYAEFPVVCEDGHDISGAFTFDCIVTNWGNEQVSTVIVLQVQ